MDRRQLLKSSLFLGALGVFPACLRRQPFDSVDLPESWALAGPPTPDVFLRPQRLVATKYSHVPDSKWHIKFSGVSAPQDFEFFASSMARKVRIYDLYPNQRDPFGIDTTLRLGTGGFELDVVDREREQELPTEGELWALNMIPFGVAIDGVILDPSGPWFDGGAPDPKNPFDRNCSGWEYDPVVPDVAALVSVIPEVRGHVQPGKSGPGSDGLFHYHGYPYLMIANLRNFLGITVEPLLVGYSADGYAIFDGVIPGQARGNERDLYLFSGYVLKSGVRQPTATTNPDMTPTGPHSGIYVQDYQYNPSQKKQEIEATLASTGRYHNLTKERLDSGQAEFALLDERNGSTFTSIDLKGADRYFYVLTRDWPEIPRYFSTLPSQSFRDIIPLSRPGEDRGRIQLYRSCEGGLAHVHRWQGRETY